MKVNTKNLVSITEANQNFSRVARMVDENGPVVILKNNTPRYLLVEFETTEKEQQADNEDLLLISKRLIDKNIKAYKTHKKIYVINELLKPREDNLVLIYNTILEVCEYKNQELDKILGTVISTFEIL